MLITLAACASAPHALPQAVPALPTTSDCEIAISASDHVDLACDAERTSCSGPLSIVVRACDAPIDLTFGGDDCFDVSETSVHINAGATKRIDATARAVGQHHLDVVMQSSLPTHETTCEVDGRCRPLDRRERVSMSKRISFVVTDRAAAAAREACAACNGIWALHGMSHQSHLCAGDDEGYTCNCRTHDHGKRCRDSDACEGWCERERFVVTGQQNGHAIGYAEGRCSELVDYESCFRPIPSGASKLPPGPDVTPEVCVD